MEKNRTTQLHGGLDQTFSELHTKKDTLTLALNAVRDSSIGDAFTYSSEPGTEVTHTFEDENQRVVGSIYGDNNTVYVFSVNANAGMSEIGQVQNCEYSTILRAPCLNFERNHPITGEYRVIHGCERVLYFNDGINPDRRINLDQLNDYKEFLNDECTAFSWDCNQMNFNPDNQPICIQEIEVLNSGGELPLGQYSFSADLLDEDLNLIQRSDISLPVNIYDDPTNDDYTQIDGGFNILQATEQFGGIQPTNKSISVCFANLPAGASFIRVNVIRAITGDGVTTDAHTIGTLIPINTDKECFIYDGFNVTRGDQQIDYSGLLIKPLSYDSSAVMEQVQGRLLRANLIETIQDYSPFQSFASKIKVAPTFNRRPTNQVVIGNPKDPNLERVSYMPDEVYALGIVYILDDGTETPVFHIPGRPATAFDKVIVSGSNSQNPYNSDQPHFRVFNSGTETTMGYYECPNNYIEPDKCCTPDYWSTDCDGNSLTGQPIRHHRMPSVTLCDNVQVLGLQITNINYPPGVTGHYIVRAQRNEVDKTVLDQGLIGPMRTEQIEIAKVDYNGIAFGLGTDTVPRSTNHVWMWSPKMAFYNEYISDCYITLNKQHSPGGRTTDIECFRINQTRLGGEKVDAYLLGDVMDFKVCNEPPQTNIVPLSTHLLDPGSFYDLRRTDPQYTGTDIQRVINLSLDNRVQHMMLPNNLQFDAHSIMSVTIKSCKDVYCNLNALTYVKTHNCTSNVNETVINGSRTQTIYGGDIYHSEAKFTDSRIFAFEETPATALLQALAIYVATIVAVLLTVATAGAGAVIAPIIIAGAVGITANLVAGLITHFSDGTYGVFTDEDHYEQCRKDANNNFLNIQGDSWMGLSTRLFSGIHLYSEINTELRHSGTDVCGEYFNGESAQDIINWMIPRFFETIADEDGDDRRHFNLTCPQYYLYNRDYSRHNRDTPYFPINTITYDFCSECQGLFPNRIIYSPQSEDVQLQDRYLRTLAADFIDIPAHRGQITGMKYIGNRLLVHTEQTTFILQPNPQQLRADQTTVFIDTGDFLGIPEIEIRQTDLGYGGSQSRIAYSLNEYGYFWVDQQNGEIFQYTSQLNEISKIGLDQWFKTNLPKSGTNNPGEITSCSSNGITLTYDNRYERLLITKRDTQSCQSWTISYSFKYQSWTSWHSYLPYYYFSDNLYFYSMDCRTATINKHLHECDYHTYYGNKYPFAIEWIQTNEYATEDLQTIHYIAQAKKFDKQHKKWVHCPYTFNKAVIATDCESTGLQNLEYIDQQNNPYQNVIVDADVMTVTPVDDHYKICGIYDFSISQPLCSSNCELLETEDCGFYQNGHGYLDEIPINTEVPTDQYQYKQLDGKYFKTRLIYVPNDEDIKQFFYLSVQNTLPSMR